MQILWVDATSKYLISWKTFQIYIYGKEFSYYSGLNSVLQTKLRMNEFAPKKLSTLKIYKCAQIWNIWNISSSLDSSWLVQHFRRITVMSLDFFNIL